MVSVRGGIAAPCKPHFTCVSVFLFVSLLLQQQRQQPSTAATMKTYVDLYQLHWPARYTPIFGNTKYERRHERHDSDEVPSIEEQVLAMGDLLKAGKVRNGQER